MQGLDERAEDKIKVAFIRDSALAKTNRHDEERKNEYGQKAKQSVHC